MGTIEVLFFWKTLLGAITFLALFGPLGYTVAFAVNLVGFRERPPSDRMLWAICVGTPIGISLPVVMEPLLSVHQLATLMAAFAVCGTALIIKTLKLSEEVKGLNRTYVLRGALIALGLALYVPLATLPISYSGHIYESLSIVDQSVRVPLIQMARQHGQPVVNPFDTVYGHLSPMRYYYYWYLPAGVVAELASLPARAAEMASAIWATICLLAVAALHLSSLFRVTLARWPIRRLCLLAVPVGGIIGLDILWMLVSALRSPPIYYGDSDFWRGASDFSPSFNLAALYAPHHLAGLALLFLIILLILPPSDIGLLQAEEQEGEVSQFARYGLAALTLFVLIGCSSFMALFACTSATLVCFRLAALKRLKDIMKIIGAGGVGVLCALPFLFRMTHADAHAQVGEGKGHVIGFSLHAWALTRPLMGTLQHALHHNFEHQSLLVGRLAVWMLLLVVELGFFGVVLWLRASRDFAQLSTLSHRAYYQWALFLGIACPTFVLTSATMAGSNDLSRHGGLALRLLGVLWATPICAAWLSSREPSTSTAQRVKLIAVMSLVILGAATQLYQVVGQRMYLYAYDKYPFLSHGENQRFPSLSGFVFDVSRAYSVIDKLGLNKKSILYNPTGLDGFPLNLYQNAFAVAGEQNCMTAFGGDIRTCHEAMPAIQALFGHHERQVFFWWRNYAATQNSDPQELRMSLKDMQELCSIHSVGAVIATRIDEAWYHRNSFVWQADPVYAGEQVRVFACPSL